MLRIEIFFKLILLVIKLCVLKYAFTLQEYYEAYELIY